LILSIFASLGRAIFIPSHKHHFIVSVIEHILAQRINPYSGGIVAALKASATTSKRT